MCKRNTSQKNEASTGCVRETPQVKMKSAWDVEEKPLKLKWKEKESSMGRVREIRTGKIK